MLNGNPGNKVLKMVHVQVKELSGTRPKFRQDQCNFYILPISCMEHWSPQNMQGFCIPGTTTIGPWRLLWQLFNEIHEQKWSSHRQLKGFPRGFGLVEKPSHGCWSRASTRFSAMAPRESAGWQQRVALAVSWAPEIPRSQIEDINLANLRGLSS